MADPDVRFTDNVGLKYPVKDLDPWDDKYIEQMDRLDATILYATELSQLYMDYDDLNSHFTYDGGTGAVASTGSIKIYSGVNGGVIQVPPFSFTLLDGYWLMIDVPAGPWNGDVSAIAVSGISDPNYNNQQITWAVREHGDLIFLLNQGRRRSTFP